MASPEAEIKTQPSGEIDNGTYEILRQRLENSGKELFIRINALNEERKNVFGAIDFLLLATDRITTENNCIPEDMVALGEYLLFGYNVHMGLRTDINLPDVFSVYSYKDRRFSKLELDKISNPAFEADFKELYKYYKNTSFEKFSVIGPYLFMIFRTGKNASDFKTFKWLIAGDNLKYEGNRSDHEYKLPQQFEFQWTRTSRDYHRSGKFPHVSVLDKVFIETIGGDLTIKVEDNTDLGEGIFSEPVEDKDQRLDDAEMYYADLGNIILLKIKPFKETAFRYIIYNHKIKSALRIDAIQDSCILLPEGHGIIFSKGYYLQTGEYKIFDNALEGLKFEKRITSPNGEDFLYVFHNWESRSYVFLPYNLIRQKVENFIVCNGYSLFENGELINFVASEEPLKHHVIQIWQTPYVGFQFIPSVVPDSYLYKIGNKDIVRCMSECTEILNLINKDAEAYANLYKDIVNKANAVLDSYFWLKEEHAFNLASPIKEIKLVADSTIEEFEKVIRIKKNTSLAIDTTSAKVREVFDFIKRDQFTGINDFVKSLSDLRALRGEVISLKDLRYSNASFINDLEMTITDYSNKLSGNTVTFLLQEKALQPYYARIEEIEFQIKDITKVTGALKVEEEIAIVNKELEMLIEIVSNLKIDDATQTTFIIDNISVIFSKINHLRATVRNKKNDLKKTESASEFSAQMKLVNQSIVSFLDISTDPDKCSDYLNKITVQLEEIESKFAEFDDFRESIIEKREEAYEAFEGRKLKLLEERAKKSDSLLNAARRILKGVSNKAIALKTVPEINGYFASDLMIDKVRDMVKQLIQLNETVAADEIQGQVKTIKEEALRQLKDRQDLFVEGANIVKFGKFHFSVNQQEPEISIINKDGKMCYHISGTDFFSAL